MKARRMSSGIHQRLPPAAATPAPPAYWLHSDWLGSARVGSKLDQSVYNTQAYAPFGEKYDQGLPTNPPSPALNVFTGQTSDMGVISGQSPLYDFLFRQYSATQGRWLVPDPAGLAAVDITNPQTWNRYVYVGNNPTGYIDPLGLKCQPTELPTLNGSRFYTLGGCGSEANLLESLSFSGQVGYYDYSNGDGMWVSQDVTDLYTISIDVSSTFQKSKFKLTNPFVKLKQLIPHVCGGGGFAYGGTEASLGPVKVEGIAVVAYDSQSGGEHGGIIAGGFGKFTAGIESTRTWTDWQEHTSYIGFVNGAQSITPTNLGPMQVTEGNYGGLVQFVNGQLVVGTYGGVGTGGGRAFGGGFYLSLSWGGC